MQCQVGSVPDPGRSNGQGANASDKHKGENLDQSLRGIEATLETGNNSLELLVGAGETGT